MKQAELEVCVDTMAGLTSCLQAGVDRIELCSALAVGGLTPSPGFMQLAGDRSRHKTAGEPGRLPASAELETSEGDEMSKWGGESDGSEASASRPQIMAMIRPRSGDFCFSEAETDSMCTDVEFALAAGLDGVVLGAATLTGMLDLAVLTRLCQAAGSMSLTLHRVIDLLDDPLLAIDQAIDLGFDRILTSGGAVGVADGLLQLTEMQKYAAGRIQIMAGSGLNPALARLIRSETGIEAYHASCRRAGKPDELLCAFGFSGNEGRLDVELIDDFRRTLAATENR